MKNYEFIGEVQEFDCMEDWEDELEDLEEFPPFIVIDGELYKFVGEKK